MSLHPEDDMSQEPAPLQDWQKELLDRRLARAKAEPDLWLTEEELRERIAALRSKLPPA